MTAERAGVVVVGAGGLGSATAWQLARRGVDVVLLERFVFGHGNGASHDTSRILRRSYHTPRYVRLAGEAYDDWADLEREAGERLVTTTGGLDLFPPGAAIPAVDYTASLDACGVPYEELSARRSARAGRRSPRPTARCRSSRRAPRSSRAGRTTATLRRRARARGARLYDHARVVDLIDHDGEVEVVAETPQAVRRVRAHRVVLTADAWTNDLLAPLGVAVPLTVLREQVTYFAPRRPADFDARRLPVWIWMDDPSFYGFPTYPDGGHGALVKAAQDCGGAATTADTRSFDPDPAALDRLSGFVRGLLPGAGPPHHTVTCLYTLTPDRDFVLDAVPGHESVYVGLGAAHAFKFAPTFGRILADLATTGATGSDIAGFELGRPALVDPDHAASWLV